MFLLELWDSCLSYTRPTLSGGFLLVCAQMLIGAVPPLLTLFRSVRRKNAGETVLLCMVPGIFIVTAAIVEPLFFGSFLGDGFPWTHYLRRFLDQPAFFREMLVLTGVFLLLAALFLLLSRETSRFLVLHILLSVGVEAVVAAAALAVGADYFLARGQMFWSMGDQTLKLLVYGLYLLLYKGTLFLVCLIWCLLFSERRDRTVETGRYLLWLRRWFAQGSRAVGWGLLLFSGLWAFAVVGGLYREGGWAEAGWTLPPLAAMLVIGLLALLRGLAPGLNPGYRRALTWGDPEETARRLYREVVQLPPLVHTDLGDLTEHYLVMKVPRRIYCRALLDRENSRTGGNINVLRFRDGGSCRINGVYRTLLDPMLEEHHTFGRNAP